MTVVLGRYGYFFDLFVDFDGYVDFFLLQDFLGDTDEVAFFLEFEGFRRSPIPQHPLEYLSYRAASDDLTRARNRRISAFTVAQG